LTNYNDKNDTFGGELYNNQPMGRSLENPLYNGIYIYSGKMNHQYILGQNGSFLKWGYPLASYVFNKRVFHCQPSSYWGTAVVRNLFTSKNMGIVFQCFSITVISYDILWLPCGKCSINTQWWLSRIHPGAPWAAYASCLWNSYIRHGPAWSSNAASTPPSF